MNVKENLITLQLLTIYIFRSKGMASEFVGIKIDATTSILVTAH